MYRKGYYSCKERNNKESKRRKMSIEKQYNSTINGETIETDE